jgi:four helix bundle protein
MSPARAIRDLHVWHKATDLVVAVYRETRAFPTDERFGLTGQMRRAAVSVVANIGEGAGRATRGEFANCLSIARGSLKELETLLEVARRLGLIEAQRVDGLWTMLDEISRMLTGLRRSIQRKPSSL